MNRHQRRAAKARGDTSVRVRTGITATADGKFTAFARLTLDEHDETIESGTYDDEASAMQRARELGQELRQVGAKLPGVRLG